MDNTFDNNNYNSDAYNDDIEELIDDNVVEHVSDELYELYEQGSLTSDMVRNIASY